MAYRAVLFVFLFWPLSQNVARERDSSITGRADTSRLPHVSRKHSDETGIERRDSGVKQIDAIDVVRGIFRSKKAKKDSAFQRKPSNLHIGIVPAVGYTLSTGFAALISGNAAFYTADPKDVRLSTLSSSLTYTQKSQILFPILSSIWFDKNRYNLISDWRGLRYPQDIYSLGPRSRDNRSSSLNYTYLRLYTVLLRRISGNLYAGGGYDFDYFFNISKTSKPNGTSRQFDRYGGGKFERSAGVSLNMLYDSRHNPINADNGYYLSMAFRQNFKTLASQNKWSSLVVDARKYIELESLRSVLAFWNYDWLTIAGKPPFFNLPSTGGDTYNNTGRGYIQGRFRDRQMLYLETEWRWTITRNGLLGMVAFTNAQSYSQALKSELQIIKYGYGLGARIKLNKFSKTNIALDYGFGKGSQGVFVNLGEVF